MGLSDKGAQRLVQAVTEIIGDEVAAALHGARQAIATHKDEVRKANESVDPLRKLLAEAREDSEHRKADLALAEARVKQLAQENATAEQTIKQLNARTLELERALAEATKGQPVVKQDTIPMPPRMAAQFMKGRRGVQVRGA
jgi:chromosome segregation ATPase